MPQIPIYVRRPASAPSSPPTTISNPLPPLLHTPSGLALLEIQGTVHFPAPPVSASSDSTSPSSTKVGKFVFPHYNPNDPSDTRWMKRVYFYVGKNQRMTGECKRLLKPFAVIRRRQDSAKDHDVHMGGTGEDGERGEETHDKSEAKENELEIIEVIKYKIVFSARPEPAGGFEGDGE